MSNSSVLGELFKGRKIYVSRNTSVLVKLAIEALRTLADKGPALVDGEGLVARYMPLELLDKVQLKESLEEACRESNILVAFNPKHTRALGTCMASTVLVFSSRYAVRVPADYQKYYVSRAGTTRHIVLRSSSGGLPLRLVFAESGLKVVEKPPGIYGKAYDLLKQAMIDYGEVTVKDAVRILTLELGVSTNRAREVLLWLTRNMYLRVVKGKLSLT